MPFLVSLLLLLLPIGQQGLHSHLFCLGSGGHRCTHLNEVAFNEVFPASEPDSTRKIQDAAGAHVPAGVPPVLSRLYEVRNDMDSVARELDRLKRRALVPMGKAEDFESLEGLYVALLDAKMGMVALLRFQKEKFIDVTTGVEIQMTDHSGKRVIWMEVK